MPDEQNHGCREKGFNHSTGIPGYESLEEANSKTSASNAPVWLKWHLFGSNPQQHQLKRAPRDSQVWQHSQMTCCYVQLPVSRTHIKLESGAVNEMLHAFPQL